jgi:hypothetical protein
MMRHKALADLITLLISFSTSIKVKGRDPLLDQPEPYGHGTLALKYNFAGQRG